MTPSCQKILAASSGGGHWIELLRLIPALEGQEVSFLGVNPEYRSWLPAVGRQSSELHVVRDATSWNPLGLILLALQVFFIIVRVRPDVVISTGAAPGLFAVLFGKFFGARTIWVDSLANVDELSRAGRMVGRFTDLWLTQWNHLSSSSGPEYAGGVV